MASLMLSSKESACNERDMGSISELGRYSGGRNGNPLQYPCLANPMDRGTWWATVHGVTKSQTGQKGLSKQENIRKNQTEILQLKNTLNEMENAKPKKDKSALGRPCLSWERVYIQ